MEKKLLPKDEVMAFYQADTTVSISEASTSAFALTTIISSSLPRWDET